MTRFARPAIVGLFSRCGPTAIRGFIVAVIVDAINRVFRAGTWPHVVQKLFKRVQPCLADVNATAAVVGIALNVGIQTAFAHVVIGTIFRARSVASRVSMNITDGGDALAMQTATRARVSRQQLFDDERAFRAAITSTDHRATPCAFIESAWLQRRQSSESCAYDGFAFPWCHGVPKYSGYGWR